MNRKMLFDYMKTKSLLIADEAKSYIISSIKNESTIEFDTLSEYTNSIMNSIMKTQIRSYIINKLSDSEDRFITPLWVKYMK